MRTLVLGGARSDKSSWAEHELLAIVVASTGGVSDAAVPMMLHYIAAVRSWPDDGDFHSKVEEHRIHHRTQAREHGMAWHTVDDIDTVDTLALPKRRVLLDDVGTWLTYIIDTQGMWEAPKGSVTPWVHSLADAVRSLPADSNLFIVSPEVRLGVIPEHHLRRLFHDEIGLLN